MSAPEGFQQSILRSLKRHCPNCDGKHLFEGYLKVLKICPDCGSDNGRSRVDDVASYFTILLVGHIVIAPSLAIPALWMLPLWGSFLLMLIVVLVATLGALPFIKGAVIGALFAADQKKTRS